MTYILLFFVLLCSIVLEAKVLIITHSFNRPDFIEIQYQTFKKFLKNDYEFVVFNDASKDYLCTQINKTCKQLGLSCIRIPQEIHNRPYLKRWPQENFNHPCIRCANVVQYSLDTVGFMHDDIVMIIDSDMFLIKELNIQELMKAYDLVGVAQYREKDIVYLWNGLVFFNMKTLPNKHQINFNCGRVEDVAVDVGGHTYYYLKNNPTIRKQFVDIAHLWCFACQACQETNNPCCNHNTQFLQEQGYSSAVIKLIQDGPDNAELLMDNTFFHYRAGGNWDNKSAKYHQQKTKILHQFINMILNQH
jgi:glycosyltransferase involved in cell wall biosynthesis